MALFTRTGFSRQTRERARSHGRLYSQIRTLPIVSPHGHTQAGWFSRNEPFQTPLRCSSSRTITSSGCFTARESRLNNLKSANRILMNPRKVWRLFAKNYYLFRGTPTRLWLDYAFQESFGLTKQLSPSTADEYYDQIKDKLATPEFLPRSLYEQFQIEVLTTTDSPLDSLGDHRRFEHQVGREESFPTFRPDPVVDPGFPGFKKGIETLGALAGEDTNTWRGYLRALLRAPSFFQIARRNGNRSWASHRAHCRPE